MTPTRIVSFLRQALRRSPVRFTLVALLTALLLISLYHSRATSSPDSAFAEILLLLLRVLRLALLIMLLFSVLTLAGAFVLCRRKEKKGGRVVTMEPGWQEPGVRTEPGWQEPGARTAGAVGVVCRVGCTVGAPLLGSVKVIAVYDHAYTAPAFALHSARGRAARAGGIRLTGEARLHPPETRHYRLQSLVVCFEDALRLFSLRRTFRLDSGFSALPSSAELDAVEVLPRQSTDDSLRTDVLRRQEGEWLHFKDFEPSDDVRRIVWQMYARNKELVVRTPETMNMYASQIDLCASFYNVYTDGGGRLGNLLLNAYKRTVWGLIRQLESRDGMRVNFVADQPTELSDAASPELRETLTRLVAARWHRSLRPADCVRLGSASVCCISPLTPADELHRAIQSAAPGTAFVYIDLRRLVASHGWRGLLKDVFTTPAEPSAEIAQWRWWISPLRRQLDRNHRELFRLLSQDGRIQEPGLRTVWRVE